VQQPYRLVTLMELLRFEADAYCRLMSMIGQIMAHFNIAATTPGMTLNDVVFREMIGSLGEMDRLLTTLNLPLAQKHLARTKAEFFDKSDTAVPAFTNQSLTRTLVELTTRIVDELEERLFLSVPLSQSPLYLQSEPLFGKKVTKQFPQLLEDISEAGKCLALDRPTACVFHLMRITELTVQRFGSELGVSLVTEKNWQVILDQINAAVKKRDHRDAKTKAYASAASHLYNIKVAWRNEVMHPKQTYTFEEARSIFDNVRTFTSELASIL
jgi:hypothetical protein